MDVHQNCFTSWKSRRQSQGLLCKQVVVKVYSQLNFLSTPAHTGVEATPTLKPHNFNNYVFFSFFFSGAHLTHFACEVSQNYSQSLFNHHVRIIQRVSAFDCVFMSDNFPSLCVQYNSAFPRDILHNAQTIPHLGGSWGRFFYAYSLSVLLVISLE